MKNESPSESEETYMDASSELSRRRGAERKTAPNRSTRSGKNIGSRRSDSSTEESEDEAPRNTRQSQASSTTILRNRSANTTARKSNPVGRPPNSSRAPPTPLSRPPLSNPHRKVLAAKRGLFKKHIQPVGPAKAVKKRRYIPGGIALKEIRRYQASVDLLIPRLPFQRLVREVLLGMKANFRLQSLALEALQESAEMFLVERFADANLYVFFCLFLLYFNSICFIGALSMPAGSR